MEFNLKKILQALLFSTGEWLSIKDIQAVITRYHEQNAERLPLENAESELDGGNGEETQSLMQDLMAQVPTLLTATQIREAMDEIDLQFTESAAPYKLLQGPNGFRLTIAPNYAEWVRLLRNDPRPQKLTQAALETLAIVAYRQPVTRAEIESIRGVNADSAIARLSDKGLIHITGRADLPGRPLQYGTTAEFLEFIGLTSLEELPASDVLSPNQISEWIKRASNPQLFKNEDVGLPAEEAAENYDAEIEEENDGAEELPSGEDEIISEEEKNENE